MKKKIAAKDILILQLVIVIYTFAGVFTKLTSGQDNMKGFALFYCLELMILGIYAVLWQQLIKRFELSIAYTNRAMALLWSLLWSVLFFHNTITVKNVVGVLLVIAGTLIVNGEGRSGDRQNTAAGQQHPAVGKGGDS